MQPSLHLLAEYWTIANSENKITTEEHFPGGRWGTSRPCTRRWGCWWSCWRRGQSGWCARGSRSSWASASVLHALPSEIKSRWMTNVSRVSFALDKNCWVCPKWLLHSTVAGLPRGHSRFETGMATGRVECSIHFAHTQQFLSNAKLNLNVSL